MKLFYVFHWQSHDSKLDDVCPKSGSGTMQELCWVPQNLSSPHNGWQRLEHFFQHFQRRHNTVQCTTHNADWRQIVGTEQKKDKLLFFAFNAYSASCNVSALELELCTLVLLISLHQFDI